MKALKIVLLLGGGWIACLITGFVLTGICAGVTERWGAARTGTAMMWFLLADAALFAISAILVYVFLGRWLAPGSGRVLFVVGYAAGLAVIWLLVAFMSAVALNR
ncbi:MAG: hypothetical protein AB1714_21955 [Acidobacteriota bacterium]